MTVSNELRTLIYLSYGEGLHVLEIIFSVLSAKKFLKSEEDEIKIIVFTDHPECFATLGIETYYVDKSTLDVWLGGEAYVHRRKLMCVREALRLRGGSLVFVDSDTYVTRSPKRLFERVSPGRCCLHLMEVRLSDRPGKPTHPLSEVVSKHAFYDLSGKQFKLSSTDQMWNSGVIGIHALDANLIDEAINLTDALWPKVRSVMTVEQFSIGVVLKNNRISETSDIVVHYWRPDIRVKFREHLARCISCAVPLSVQLEEIWPYRPRPNAFERLKGRVKRLITLSRLPIPMFRSSYG